MRRMIASATACGSPRGASRRSCALKGSPTRMVMSRRQKRPSRARGVPTTAIGRIGAPERSAMCAIPGFARMSAPLSLRCPSGKYPSGCPAASTESAIARAPRSASPRRTGKQPMPRRTKPMTGTAKSSRLAM